MRFIRHRARIIRPRLSLRRACARRIIRRGKEQGLMRLEGKDYIMQEGDVVNFRFMLGSLL